MLTLKLPVKQKLKHDGFLKIETVKGLLAAKSKQFVL